MPDPYQARMPTSRFDVQRRDALSDSPGNPLERLHSVFFGDRLCSEAQQLVDSGGVSDIRILQTGSVVTGIASAGPQANQRTTRHRVYIQYRTGGPEQRIEAECSCSERSPCLHVAAVSIAAAGISHKPADQCHSGSDPAPRRSANVHTRSAPAHQQQRLCYLLDSASSSAAGLELSVWVGQTSPGDERIQAESACPFAPRPAEGSGEYPRYVDARDSEILQALTAQHFEGPWKLHGEAGTRLLQQAVATGRAFWQSIQGRALQTGAVRLAHLAWETLPNGDQQLRCDAAGAFHIVVDAEPALYIDADAGEWGHLELPCSLSLLRQYWNQPPTSPEQVATVNERIARDASDTPFPRLREISVRRQARSSLRPRLVLSGGPEATLHFIYNGLAVESRLLRPGQHTVRRMDGQADGHILYEIDRDHAAEQRLQAQLDRMPATTRQDSEAWLAFMMNAVPALQAEDWEVVADERFPYRLAAADNWYADMQAARRDAWFDLRLGVLVDGQPVNLLPALVGYLQTDLVTHNGSHYRIGDHLLVRLDDGRYLPVPLGRIQRIADTLVELLDRDALNKLHALSLPASQASRLAQLAQELDRPTLQSNDESMLALIGELEDFSGIQPLAAPAHFQATLRSYQQEGLGWLQFLRRCRLGGILADDMGLGKTVQTLAHLVLEKQQGRLRKPSLIVAPVSVIGNWQQEIRRFAPELKLLTLHGAKRKELFAAIDRSDVVITGYPALQLDSEILLAREFCFVILDEAQMIKNPRAKVSQAARALRAEHRLCLTGTPMENHLGELWSLFDFLQPGLLGGEKQFQRQYRMPIEKNGDSKRAAALSRRIAPFVLRRTKDAVAKELPPKTLIVESIVLDERQRDFYDGIRLAMHQRVRDIIQHQGLARSQITVLDALLKLRQACCDPRLVRIDAQSGVDTQTRAEVSARTIPSAKMEWLRNVLPELVAEGRRILLFSQFTSMLRLIQAAVTELSIPYCLLTGETPDRAAVVRQFQAGGVPLFLISLKAGGTGLNLTAADTVIHYDPWWNPAAEAQATDRAHRIGQDQPVFVYKLIAQGTVEEKIMQLQADKHALANQLYTQQNASPSQLSAADLETLFAP